MNNPNKDLWIGIISKRAQFLNLQLTLGIFLTANIFASEATLSLQIPDNSSPPAAETIRISSREFWANESSAWSVKTIVIGGMSYSKAQVTFLMQTSSEQDKRLTMFASLACAKLNVISGKDAGEIADSIAQADKWMRVYGKSKVTAHSEAWKVGSRLNAELESFNKSITLSSLSN